MHQILIRHSSSMEDVEHILAAFDSTLPHLEAKGSGQQWGSQPLSERPGSKVLMQTAVKDSLEYQVTGDGKYVEVFITEVEVDPADPANQAEADAVFRTSEDGKRFVQTGAMVTTTAFSHYLNDKEEMKSILEEAEREKKFIYLSALVSDYRAGPLRKGAGAALIEHAKHRARKLGKKTIFLDCFGGNGGHLVKFYETSGCRVVAALDLPKPNEAPWPCRVMRLDVSE
ncbi:hypothetical protein AJ78_05824 [Emergomyces pasteurianus Ep9510]|uniref:N-acetyltransferase domain-containing protein n=1 Tax=Emergomyces pasteurianus Ep9510 TaxID=1447872 RepID=A0A1J9PCN5_9EURO|nr:hypothetical protein AJ78_05824 [Emergomyces pasteurianus Ep9510]